MASLLKTGKGFELINIRQVKNLILVHIRAENSTKSKRLKTC